MVTGFLGVVAMLLLSLHENLHLALALLSLTAGNAGEAVADVTMDACVAQNSISHPSLAADMQSLCAFNSSVGALLGFSISGIFVHLIGPMGVFGLMTLPAGLVILVGFLLDEPRMSNFSYRQVKQNFFDAGKAMWTTLKRKDVWRPCLYMNLSLALSLNILEGMFYWATDSKGGPSFSQDRYTHACSLYKTSSVLRSLVLNRRCSIFYLPAIEAVEPHYSSIYGKITRVQPPLFCYDPQTFSFPSNMLNITVANVTMLYSGQAQLRRGHTYKYYAMPVTSVVDFLMQESIGFIFSVSSVGSLIGAILYQYALKDYAFRDLLFWTQLFYGLSGMLELILVLRWNLKIGIPDYFFVVIAESIGQMTNRLKWMPMLVLSSKLCPSGIEGTFFALLMSIDNAGLLSASWGGGFVLHILKVTRTRFDNLWLAILIRNGLRITPLCLLFLVPRVDPNSFSIIQRETKNLELLSLVNSADGK
ncbi:hypothetical protein RIF29_27250 [Crotalaria pallida]|uniref:Uncharacterized protein n=1 Tax=Crotalaria pallida TaxID=3830 RepID=A0AAN9HYK6_CROPI